MGSRSYIIFIFGFLLFFLFPLDSKASEEKVVFISYENDEIIQELTKHDIEIIKDYKLIQTIAVEVNDEEKTFLKQLTEFEEDATLHIDQLINSSEVSAELHNLNIPTMWEKGHTGEKIKIAIIDTGISPHEDLEITDAISFVDNEQSNSLDTNGHGTQVAGIINAQLNDIGIVGISYNAAIYSLKAFNDEGNGSVYAVVNAINWAIENEMDIINFSFGTEEYNAVLENMIDKAYEQGITMVGASGNNGLANSVQYPAKFDTVIAVGSVNSSNERSVFSNYGNEVEVVSPGESIYTTTLNNQYTSVSGTSFSAPYVSGFIALLKNKFPDDTNSEIRQRLSTYTTDLGGLGKDNEYGHGLITYQSSNVHTEQTELEDNIQKDKLFEKYFLAMENNIPIYKEQKDNSVILAYLIEDQEYSIVNQYNNWLEIKIGKTSGYVNINHVVPIANSSFNNANNGYQITQRLAKVIENTIVYDNTSDKLVPFGVLEKDMLIDIVSDYGNWWRVDFAGRIGYILKSKTVTDFISSDKFFLVTEENLEVYDNRKGYLELIGTLMKGQVYPRTRDYGNWHQIQFGNYYGYVLKSGTRLSDGTGLRNENKTYSTTGREFTVVRDTVIYDNTSGKLVPYATIHKGTKATIATDYGNWWRVIIGGKIGYLLKEDVKVTFNASDKYFRVNEENLEVYDNRKGYLELIGTLKKGQIFPRTRDYGNWHQIQFGNYYGYVLKSGTTLSDGTGLRNENKTYSTMGREFTVARDTVIYDNTSGKLVPYATIHKGTKATIATDYGNWWRVIIGGKIGYLLKEDVKVTFNANDKYFQVMKKDTPVYDNRSGRLKLVGLLEKGQVYSRVSDYGNWHQIQFGDYYGYILKSDTTVAIKPDIGNENKSYKNTKMLVKTKIDTPVYDNSAGKLVKFSEIKKNTSYAIVSNYGNWYRILLGNRVGYILKDNLTGIFGSNVNYFEARDNIPIYDNRSGSLVEIGEVLKGQTYKIDKDYGNWHRIIFGDHYGYVLKKNTLPSFSTSYQNGTSNLYSIGSVTAIKDTFVYDNTGSKLVPFSKLNKGKSISVIRDYGNWVEVVVGNRYGYILKEDASVNIITPRNIINPKKVYTYEAMQIDISKLEKQYPGLISSQIIGKSIDGRNLYAIKLGKGTTEIFLNGAHHAREWLTTNLLMEMIDTYSQAYAKNTSVDGYNARKILNDVSIWFVPMVNPDGVTLVQKGAFSAKNPAEVIRLNGGSTNFNRWKANIRGVDLNRQYPAGWSTIQNARPYPSYMNYKGKFALSEPETMAIYQFTKKHDFKTAVAYHSSGEILYWNYKLRNGTSLMNSSKSLANKIKNKTGYSLYMPGSNPSGGGYTDWFIESEKKPGFTPEISPHVGERPVPLSYFDRIWKQNNSIGLMLAEEAYLNRNKR